MKMALVLLIALLAGFVMYARGDEPCGRLFCNAAVKPAQPMPLGVPQPPVLAPRVQVRFVGHRDFIHRHPIRALAGKIGHRVRCR